MKGLILKDIMNMRAQLKIYLIIIVLWLVLGIMNDSGSFFAGVMVMFVVMIPMTAMAYDDKVKWNSYALTMPVSRKDLVASKYVMVLLGMALVAVLSVIGCYVISRDMESSLTVTLSVLPIGLILNAVLLPIIFKFGVEKGRFMFIGVAVLFAIGIVFLGKNMDLAVKAFSALAGVFMVSDLGFIDDKGGILILFVIAVIATLISIAISVKIYNNKDF